MEKAFLKEKKEWIALAGFVIVALAAIILGICIWKVPVVAMCVLVILEVGIAVMLHNAELWFHAVVILIEVIAGVLAARVAPILLCIAVYVAAAAVLRVLDKGEEQ